MNNHYGHIDTKNMPPPEVVRQFERESREIEIPEGRSADRSRSEYIWDCIRTYQEKQRGRDNTGRSC